MKTTLYFAAAAATLLMASSAQASGISFHIDGQRIRIEAPRNCGSLSCISVTDNGSAINMKHVNLKSRKSDDVVEVASNTPQVASPASPAPAVEAPPAPAPVANTAPPAPPPAATNTVAEQLAQLKKLDSAAAPTPAVVADATPPAPSAPPVKQEAAAAATTPFGLWQTDQGNVRVEQCGTNLCGYGEKNGKKSNELVLINMKPSHGEWVGRVHNPNSGKNYDATVTLKGPNQMRLQGCALGGLICGGTTWKRVS